MTILQCPVCESRRLTPFLQRSQVPVHQNLVVTSQDAARSVTRGELDLVVCEDCGFVFNRAFDLSRLAYGEGYDNTQSCSAYFEAYLDGLVKDLVVRQGVRNSTIVEVGCGKGQFLRKLVSFPGANNKGFGFDPSYVGPDADLDGRLAFRRCYYDDTCTDVAADVVVCRHVIEHVPQPLQLLKSVRQALADSPRARVFFETPCVEWILRHQVLWDFFYEHCSLFTASSLASAFGLAGFRVESVRHLFGEQYLWIEASVSAEMEPPRLDPGELPALAEAYAVAERSRLAQWRRQLADLSSNSRIAVWGAGAKGATFVNLVDPDCRLIDCIVDLNPNKQGRFVPGTGHPIVEYHELAVRGIQEVLLMNPNYRDENLALLRRAGIPANLVEWN